MSGVTISTQDDYSRHHQHHQQAHSESISQSHDSSLDSHFRDEFHPDYISHHDHSNTQHSNTESMPSNKPGTVNFEVSARQKMLAACSGSLLTSLLVTPLDVVRVRLQSQDRPPAHTSSSLPSSTTSNALNRGARLPFQSFTLPSATHITRPITELGVTSCCREVFWVSSTNEFCLAAPAVTATFPGSSSFVKSTEACLVEQSANRQFSGTWEGLVKIARNEGLPSLYRGLSPTLLMAIPANVIYFTGYDALRFSDKSPFSKLSDNTAPLVAGSIARTIAATVIGPLELFRTRLQAVGSSGNAQAVEGQLSAFRETMQGVKSMVMKDGPLTLWRGLTLTLWRDVPFSGIYWWGYETVRTFLTQERYGRKHQLGHLERHRVDNELTAEVEDSATFVDSFTAGAVSGAVAAFITTPFDVGKTRRQVWKAATDEVGTTASASTMKGDGSMPKVLMEIYQREGLQGLFRGCTPRMLKVAPACAIMISSYEIGKKTAMKINERRNREKTAELD